MVQFIRHILANGPTCDKVVVSAAWRAIFAQMQRESAAQQLRQVAGAMWPRQPKDSELMQEAEDHILSYRTFQAERWSRIHSNNPLERLGIAINRHSCIVRDLPAEPFLISHVGPLPLKIADEGQVPSRSLSDEWTRKLTDTEIWLVFGPTPFWLAPVH